MGSFARVLPSRTFGRCAHHSQSALSARTINNAHGPGAFFPCLVVLLVLWGSFQRGLFLWGELVRHVHFVHFPLQRLIDGLSQCIVINIHTGKRLFARGKQCSK